MTPFELTEPCALREAVMLIDGDDLAVRAIAGGTALMLMMKTGVFQPTRLVSLRRVEPQYSDIGALADRAGGGTGHHADSKNSIECAGAQCGNAGRASGTR
jgi:FAD binding domain in molybdopterin dehydrogenase